MKTMEWTTQFEDKVMYHLFSDRITVITYFDTGYTKVFKDGKSVRELPIIANTCEYVKFLEEVGKDAEIVEQFNQDK